MKNLVTTNWLLENLNKEALIILDCRFDMNNLEYGINAYKSAHIENSKFISLEYDMMGKLEIHGGRHPLPDMNKFAKKLETVGVNDKSIVLIYDDGDLQMASKLWWMLKYLGKDNVYVLEGGFKEWTSSGLETTSKIDISSKSGELNVNLNSDMICDVNFIRNNIENEDSKIIDSRSNERYLGISEPIDKKAGHIKSAENYFWQENFQDGKLKNIEDLKKRFNNLKNYNNLIVYCGSGITACPNIIVMQEIGLEPVLYLGGWSDWISYEENEVVGLED